MTSQYLHQPSGEKNIGNYMGEFLADVTTFGGVARGEQAARNHHARLGDWGQALWLGAIAGRRWTVYYSFWVILGIYCVISFFGIMAVGTAVTDAKEAGEAVNEEGFNWIYGWTLSVPLCWSALLVIHKRNVDFGLHRRGMWYHLARPLAWLTNWLPNWIVYSTFVVAPLGLGLALLPVFRPGVV
jgi:hypothetical protein